jgi:hypothetical protein
MKRKVDKKRNNPAAQASGYFDMYAGSKSRQQHGNDRIPRTNKLKVKLADVVGVRMNVNY